MVSNLDYDVAQAMNYIESGAVQEGLELLKKLKNSPHLDVQFQVAQTYANYGFLEDAIEIADQLLLKTSDEELLIFVAECFIDLGQDEKAIERLEAFSHIDETDLRPLLLLADLYQAQGLAEVAEHKLLKAFSLNDSEPVIWFALAEFYLHEYEYQKAIHYYEKLLDLEALTFIEVEVIYLHYAEALSQIGAFEKALSFFQKGLQSSTQLDGLFKYGYTAMKAEQYRLAIQVFEELKDADEHYSTLYPYLAHAYEKIGALDEALETLKLGLKFDEYNEELYLALSELLLKMGHVKEAEYYLHEIFQFNPTSLKASERYLSILKREGRYDEVVSHILDMKSANESAPFYEWDLAEAYYELEKFDQARKHYEEAALHFSNDSIFLEQFGRFLLEEGETDQALINFKKALQVDPNLYELEELVLELEESNHF